MKRLTFKKKIDSELYVNINTGELLSSEYNVNSINVKHPKLIVVNSDEYVIIDSNAMRYVLHNFNSVEVGKIVQMTDMVKGDFNLLYDYENECYYNVDELGFVLEYGRTKMFEFIKKLTDKSICIVLKTDRKKQKVISLNPTFARKRKSFDYNCIKHFIDLSKYGI